MLRAFLSNGYVKYLQGDIDMSEIDITDQVTFGWNDGEDLPLTKCVCGKKWPKWAGPLLGTETSPRHAIECPSCGRKLCWDTQIQVFEIIE